MKLLSGRPFDQWRDHGAQVIRLYGNAGDSSCGVFNVPVANVFLRVIASAVEGWDHVSVSTPTRCPTWEEMSAIKREFFRRNEWAYELHPPQSENLSLHPYCLHMWRPHFVDVPLPPPMMVAPPSAKERARILERTA